MENVYGNWVWLDFMCYSVTIPLVLVPSVVAVERCVATLEGEWFPHYKQFYI